MRSNKSNFHRRRKCHSNAIIFRDFNWNQKFYDTFNFEQLPFGISGETQLYSAAGIREMLLPFWDGGNTMRDGGCLYMKYVDQEVNVLFSFAAVEYKRIK